MTDSHGVVGIYASQLELGALGGHSISRYVRSIHTGFSESTFMLTNRHAMAKTLYTEAFKLKVRCRYSVD